MYVSNKNSPSYRKIKGQNNFIGHHKLTKKDVIEYFKKLHPKNNTKFKKDFKEKIPDDLIICERCGRWFNYNLKCYKKKTNKLNKDGKEKTIREYKIEKNKTIIQSFIHKIGTISILMCKQCKKDKKQNRQEATPDIEDIERFEIEPKQINLTN